MVQSVVRVQVDSKPEEVAASSRNTTCCPYPLSIRAIDWSEQAEEDLLHLAGVAAEERVTTPAPMSFKMRFLWLAINLATAFLASWVVSWFQGTIAKWAARPGPRRSGVVHRSAGGRATGSSL